MVIRVDNAVKDCLIAKSRQELFTQFANAITCTALNAIENIYIPSQHQAGIEHSGGLAYINVSAARRTLFLCSVFSTS